MKAFSIACIIAILATFAPAQKIPASYVENELLVKFPSGTKEAAEMKTIRRAGTKMLEKLGDTGWVRVGLPGRMAVMQAISRYNQFTGVTATQPNFYYPLL